MNIKERAEYYRNLSIELKNTRTEDALRVGFDALGIIKARVQRSGVGADNSPFTSYSPDYAKRGRTELGYQTRYKDFTRTGELFRSAAATVSGQTEDTTTILLGPTGTKNENKAAGALGQGDAIFRLSEAEEQLVLRAYLNERRRRYDV